MMLEKVFIAVELPQVLKDKLYYLQQCYASQFTESWVNRGKMHITVAWCKRADETQLRNILKDFQRDYRAFDLQFTHAGIFENTEVALWAGLDEIGGAACHTLADHARRELGLRLGSYKPHVTLVKQRMTMEQLMHAVHVHRQMTLSFTQRTYRGRVGKVGVYQSMGAPSATYAELMSVEL
jgi:2'-5' RNA ligase